VAYTYNPNYAKELSFEASPSKKLARPFSNSKAMHGCGPSYVGRLSRITWSGHQWAKTQNLSKKIT
jgi:hypothetical protein